MRGHAEITRNLILSFTVVEIAEDLSSGGEEGYQMFLKIHLLFSYLSIHIFLHLHEHIQAPESCGLQISRLLMPSNPCLARNWERSPRIIPR